MSRLAARFAQAMLDLDSQLIESYVFTFVQAGTTNPLPIYADAEKSSVLSTTGQASSDSAGNLLVWIDDQAFDLYIHGVVTDGQLVSGTLVQPSLYPIATPGDADEPFIYVSPGPITITPTIVHGLDRYPQVAVADNVSGQQIGVFGCTFPTLQTAIITLLTPRSITVTFS